MEENLLNPADYYSKYYNQDLVGIADSGNMFGAEMSSTWLGTIWNDIIGKTSQNREFAQQEYLQDKMNLYNTPANQMQRMAEAGINLNTAAAGIAGSGSESAQAPQVSTNNQGVSNGLNTLNNVGSTIVDSALIPSQVDLNKANARKSNEESDVVKPLANAEVMFKAGSFAKLLTESGIEEIEAMEAGLSIASGGVGAVLAVLKAPEVCRHIDRLNDLLDADIARENKEYEKLENECKVLIDLAESEEERNLAEARLADARTQHENKLTSLERRRIQQWDEFGGDPYLDIYKTAYRIRTKYGADSEQYRAYMSAYKDVFYYGEQGKQSAEVQNAYDKAYNAGKGANESEMDYIARKQWYKEHEDEMKRYNEFIYSIPKDSREAFFKYVGAWNHALRGAPEHLNMKYKP